MDPGEDRNVSDDHILLQNICDANDITAKQLTMLIGRARCTTHRYLDGISTIPSIVWRVVYSLTKDPRIPQLVTGDVPVVVMPLKDVDMTKPVEGIHELIETRKLQIAYEESVLKIIADGRIDQMDAREIDNLRSAFPAAIQSLSEIYFSITAEYKRKCDGHKPVVNEGGLGW